MTKIITSYRNIAFEVVSFYNGKDFNEILMTKGSDGLKEIVEKTQPGLDFVLTAVIKYNKPSLKELAYQERIWKILSRCIGAREEAYHGKYPINTIYTPVVFNKIWDKFDYMIRSE